MPDFDKSFYDEYINSPEWDSIRRGMLRKAEFRCERCFANEPLEVHHRHYDTLGFESYSDLEALCKECHDEADEERKVDAEDRRIQREEEWELERWESRLDGWASAIYGMDWQEWNENIDVEEAFIAWLSQKGEEIPAFKRTRLFKSTTTESSDPHQHDVEPKLVPAVLITNDSTKRDKYLTITRMKAFKQCPYKYSRTYSAKHQSLKSLKLAFSDFFKRRLAAFFNEQINSGNLVNDDTRLSRGHVAELYRLEFFNANGKCRADIRMGRGESLKEIEELLPLLVNGVNQLCGSILKCHTIIGVNVPFTIFHKDVEVRGRLDLVSRDTDGKLFVFHWKTGKYNPRFCRWDDPEMARLAAHGAHSVYNATNIVAAVAYLNPLNIPQWEAYDRANDYLFDKAKQMKLAIASSKFPTITGPLCDYCEWQKLGCPAFSK